MGTVERPGELLYTWWERLLNATSEAFTGDREFTELSTKLHDLRTAVFADREVTPQELERLYESMEAIAQRYAAIAARRGIDLEAGAPATRESFRVFREAAEIHFQTLAAGEPSHYRGGLLDAFVRAADPDPVAHRIVLDLLTSASAPIAADKVHLLRAALSRLDDGGAARTRLELVRRHLEQELRRPVWNQGGRPAAVDPGQFDRLSRFDSVVSVRRVALPPEIQGTNRMIPNRPFPGRDAAHRQAVRALFADLRANGRLFLDAIEPQAGPVRIAVKLDLNFGMEGPPSVTDPACTYAVIAELLELARDRGLAVRLTVGDSNGIENAPLGRTSLDVLRDTGNYHAALKAALEFASRPDAPDAERAAAREPLAAILSLEQGSSPVYFGGSDDRQSSARDLAAAEAAAERWLSCVDYDQAGFRTVDAELGPLGRAVWGSDRFHLAEPWAGADYRVHVTRGASNHVYAGWTGALKGLVGVHALGARPADRGMAQRGQHPLDVLAPVMQTGGITGLFAARGGVDFTRLAAACADARCRAANERAARSWNGLSGFAAGRQIWVSGAAALEKRLRADRDAGVPDVELMAQMRRGAAALLADAERASPGFRASFWQGAADATTAFLLTTWLVREQIPPEMRDERIGLRIGVLSHLPRQSDLVVQGMPKTGLGGGPDAYFEVRDVGVVVAGTDEVSVDVTALREAGVGGNPWAFNHPIHAALQFGRGPMAWDEIRVLGGRGESRTA